jgi:hypothetical protein
VPSSPQALLFQTNAEHLPFLGYFVRGRFEQEYFPFA